MSLARLRKALHLRLTPKVFFIGFHRTGTTTLHRCFEILGYVAKHGAPAELYGDLRSPIFRQHSAFSDLPFPLMYPQLDRHFSRARFILIVRDADSWLASCEHLFSRSAEWSESTHRLHELTYGRRTFDAEAMKRRYLRHNREVLDYFYGRSNLLVMDIERGDGWRELCRFLHKPLPREDFPHLNRRGEWYW